MSKHRPHYHGLFYFAKQKETKYMGEGENMVINQTQFKITLRMCLEVIVNGKCRIFISFSQSSNFNGITIWEMAVFFSPLFSTYVLFVWNKLCPPVKRLIFRRVWSLLILLIVLELIYYFAKLRLFHLYVANIFFSTVTNCIHWWND